MEKIMKLQDAKTLKPGMLVCVGDVKNKGFVVVATELKKSASGRSTVLVSLEEVPQNVGSWPGLKDRQSGQARWPLINAQQSHLNIHFPTQQDFAAWKAKEDSDAACRQAHEKWQQNEKAKRDAFDASVEQLKTTFHGSTLSSICDENGVNHEKLNALRAFLLAAGL